MTMKSVSIIIGGSKGMGRAIAQGLAEQGNPLLLVGRDQGALTQAKQELETAFDIRVNTFAADLYQSQDVDALITHIDNLDTGVAHLVNAAGYFKPVSFLEHSAADYDAQLDINKAFFFVTQAAAKKMKSSGGAIVNIGSMWAHQAVKATPSSAYSMQKAGLHALTQHLAMELAEFNIRANAIAPAVVLSSIYKSFMPEEKIAENLQGFNDFSSAWPYRHAGRCCQRRLVSAVR